MKGDAVKIIMGACNSYFVNISPTVPPATLRNALPAMPSKKRDTNIVPIFLATAQGTSQIMKNTKEVTYIGRRP